ncbi:hypothetical protein EDB92DRAFT_1954569 [Lactarius akahatsu]|uniref:Uncharacterized protein n=1 Tax=Lactarius akahatsu TaxID=416441 RepID=A0AAD4L8P9_9AGAM|nr:hypothetical protein EDB92DRAFT_1954569 [Lactarius akahatsu]
MDMDEDDAHGSHEATSQGASDWVSDRNDGGDIEITSDEDDGESGLGLGDSQRALNAALDDICRGRIPTDLGPLTCTDRALNIWDDRECLQKACAPLLVMSKSMNFNALLRARLTGMVGVLNLYLDPALQYTWRRASEIVSKIEGKGMNRAQMLRQWILEFVRSGDIPLPQYSHSRQTVLDDEDISQFIQLQIMAHTKGHYLTASDIVKVVAGEAVQEKFSHSGITKPTISERTACRWLQKLNWHFGPTQNGMYLDGHECPDVVAYREAFVRRWKEYEKRFHLWDNDGNLLPLPNGFPVMISERLTGPMRAISPPHIRKGMDSQSWFSDFLTSEWGRLHDDPDDNGLDGEKPQEARIFFEAGLNRDGYFSADNLLEQVDGAIDIFEGKTKGMAQGLFLFDNAPSHQKRAADALSARKMPKHPKEGWTPFKDAPRMRHGIINPQTEELQSFYFPDDHPTMPGRFKGMEQIIQERGLWPEAGLLADVFSSTSLTLFLRSHSLKNSFKDTATSVISTPNITVN